MSTSLPAYAVAAQRLHVPINGALNQAHNAVNLSAGRLAFTAQLTGVFFDTVTEDADALAFTWSNQHLMLLTLIQLVVSCITARASFDGIIRLFVILSGIPSHADACSCPRSER